MTGEFFVDPVITRARSGDESAMEEFLRDNYNYVYAISRNIVRDEHDAHDAAQEALIAIAKSLQTYRGESSTRTWIFRVATNASLRYYNRRKKQQDRFGMSISDEDNGAHPQLRSQGAVDDLVSLNTDLVSAINRLPDEYSQTLLLRVSGGLSYNEIAELLVVPLGTVQSRLARAKEILLKEISGEHSSVGADLHD